MSKADLELLLQRVQTWPEAAQKELVALANQIENELKRDHYVATADELRVIDAAAASIDAGEAATGAEIEAVFAKFRAFATHPTSS